MKTIKLSLLLFITTILSISANAQSQGVCYTDELFNQRAAQDPSLLQKMQDLENYIANFKSTYDPATQKMATIIIPVVVHNVTHDGGIGYVSKATIDAQIDRLNTDFQKLNSDTASIRSIFVPYAAKMDVEFRLAHLDPSGNCTEGIVRKESPFSYNTSVNDNVKSVSYWDSKKYFNIWVIDEIQDNGDGTYVAGFAQFAGSGINNTYGVVVCDQNFNGNDRVLTHEVGHCFNLFHTFQGNCGSNCSSSGDYCCDTPPTSDGGFGCSTTSNTCSNDANGPDPYGTNVVDQFENFMSYSNCTHMFSLDQKTRMMAVLNSTNTSTGLAQLSTGTNLAATGVANPYGPVICAPIAEFDYNKEYICEGGSVTFTDNSYNATPTSWSWTFNGGTPNTSPLQNPVITYNTAGVYNATLVSTTTAGSSAPVTKNSIVTVSSLTADYVGPIIDGFENTTQFNADWRIEQSPTGGQTWQNTNAAAATGSRSVRVRNYFTNNDGEDDELISPSFDISSISAPAMKFKYAFARKTSSDGDKLLVYYSTNCGESWVLKVPMAGALLATVPNQTSLFTPGVNDWAEKVVDLSAIAGSSNVRFKFKFTSGGGNDIYLDDINITGAVGVDEFSNIGSFNVFPNPTSSSAQISFNLIKNVDNLSVKVRNSVGQEVTNVINGKSFISGNYTLNIDEQRKLPAGIYFVEFNADNVIKVQKLIVQ